MQSAGSTGGGHGERRLYTNEEEATFEGRRPVCLNGIEDVATRPDLVDRALMLLLLAIPADKRREEKEIEAKFDAEAPQILGALFDGLSAGLLNLAEVEIVGKPRMADFAKWAEACALAFWPAGSFMAAYGRNIAAANEVVIESSAVGDAVRHFMSDRRKWEGTASELLLQLTQIIPEPLARERSWPKNARALSGKLRRAAPPLRKIGIDVAFVIEGHDRVRTIVITVRSIGGDNFASASSAESEESEKRNNGKGLGADANAERKPQMRTQMQTVRTECGRKPKMDRPQITIEKITAFLRMRTLRTVRTQIPLPLLPLSRSACGAASLVARCMGR
jgi:hypothetical protein